MLRPRRTGSPRRRCCSTALRRAAAGAADEWKSPPFEPAERDGNLYARGAVDEQGTDVDAREGLESLFAAGGGRLP